MSEEANPLGGATISGPKGHKIHLPPAEKSVGPYRKALIDRESGILYTSTHFGTDSENKIVKGKVITNSMDKKDYSSSLGYISQAEAKEYARNAGKRLLATIHAALGGDLTRVVQVIKLTGFVNALINGDKDFEAHGAVISGCSEILIEAFGEEIGTGVRVCTGAGSLGCCVTCDVEVRVKL